MNFIKKYCYVSVPMIISILLVVMYFLNIFDNLKLSETDTNTLVGIIGSLVGFLLTAITIFLSLPKDSIVMKRVKKYNHHKIFARCIMIGIICSCLTIFLWMFKVNDNIIVLFFISSILEVIMSAYYIYTFCLYSFE